MVFSGKDFTLMRERNNGISPCLIGNTSSKGPFSNAMLDYRSVPEMFGDLGVFSPLTLAGLRTC